MTPPSIGQGEEVERLIERVTAPATPAQRQAALVTLLNLEGEAQSRLHHHAQRLRLERVGGNVYLRGLIELSNRCQKNCLYCGIRRDNPTVPRYYLNPEEVVRTAIEAHSAGYGSLAIQGGEIQTPAQRDSITRLLRSIMEATGGQLGITLSLGEQPNSTYRAWRKAGATRYLLRVESSNPTLYRAIHPNDGKHSQSARIEALRNLREEGYQVGTGVMIGLPGQSLDMLANDLMWMLHEDVDMVGMGPYIPHPQAPLAREYPNIPPPAERLRVSLNMVACLRLLAPSINIAATTALQTLQTDGRELALAAGANVIMPNITPGQYRDAYTLYAHKPSMGQIHEDLIPILQRNVTLLGLKIALFEQGNSSHYPLRNQGEYPPATRNDARPPAATSARDSQPLNRGE